jgi:hypothetical protein
MKEKKEWARIHKMARNKIPAKKVAKFKPGKNLAEMVNKTVVKKKQPQQKKLRNNKKAVLLNGFFF